MLAMRMAVIALFVLATNYGFLQRVALLADQGRWITMIGFFGVWLLSLVALLIAVFQPSPVARCSWVLLIAFTTASGFAYRHATGSEFSLFDGLSLWSASGEFSRAATFYMSSVYVFAIIFVCSFVAIFIPTVAFGKPLQRSLWRLVWLPAVPIAAIAIIIIAKEGGGTERLPVQFAPLSASLIVASKAAINATPQRAPINITFRGPFAAAAPSTRSLPPQASVEKPAMVRHVVMLIDESIRGDYIDWTAGNPFTPEIARLKDRLVNFGPASSGGNCSHYSNAILRFGASRSSVGRELLSNPTIWQYAKKAGFRTVFIDAQAGFFRGDARLQNFMTLQETQDIDDYHGLDPTIPPHELDDRLLDIVLDSIKSEKPVFIYANKNGAHFPYDHNYPRSARIFRPVMSDGKTDNDEGRINSFRNAVSWTVDRFFKRLLDATDLKETAIIYTSDHGQTFDPRRSTHCTVEDPDPRQSLVPLVVATGNDVLREQFAVAAEASRGRASHFSIVPTALALMGYDANLVAQKFGESLFEKNSHPAAFTSGDIFGVVSKTPRWHAIDLTADYLEKQDESKILTRSAAANQ